jgi:hypothetical protein
MRQLGSWARPNGQLELAALAQWLDGVAGEIVSIPASYGMAAGAPQLNCNRVMPADLPSYRNNA